ncbi:bifunctional 3-(3-hydroxy-phenyl)propionate/3-hydroxycinnamic acid hydroxylase [Sutcliffiella horikoshii]|uniref:bifunctional 3-(3-hydroxy-phenyl)propionate/3-hydroxycinnamic acid hydroxylase MhpA n=1 Tax=Sutcliffiella horikoshii TaxID=79883 RepID=UPI0038503112
MKPDFDVTIVGYGPVGSVLAILLGKKGYKVGVFERWPRQYPHPRAIVYDDEIARMIRLICGQEVSEKISENIRGAYEWRNASGDILLSIKHPDIGPSGMPAHNFFNQPDLELVLNEVCKKIPSVSLYRGYEAVNFIEKDDFVEIVVVNQKGEQQSFSSSYLVGCDGANSMVRKKMNVEYKDLGFAYTWLVVDIIPYEQKKMEPNFWQLCDPKRPTTIVPGGPGRRRWEFMSMPGETVEELNNEKTAWKLLKPWGYTKENCQLVRHAVYTFRGAWAENWRKGRVMIAGDAAHLTPPFIGQGMCSGLRDAWGLAWKLDLVLRNVSQDNILETYSEERNPNVQGYIHMAVELGKMICVTDPLEAANRDQVFLSGNAGPFPPYPHLTTGIIYNYSEQPSCLAGRLSVQGNLKHGEKVGLLDDLIGSGWTIISTNGNPNAIFNKEQKQFLDVIGTHFIEVTLDASNDNAYYDMEGTYKEYFQQNQMEAIIIRPDFYVFGAAASKSELTTIVDELKKQMHYQSPVSFLS